MGSTYAIFRTFGYVHESSANVFLDAFIRDELSKGRYDPAISKICFEMLLELLEER